MGSCLVSQLSPKPGQRPLGIGHGLLRRERLGDDDDERRTSFAALQGLIQMERVHIAHEADIERSPFLGPHRCKGFVDHDRPEVGPPDANVDDVGEATAGHRGVSAFPDRIREVENSLPGGQHVLHHGLAVHDKGVFRSAAQGHVQYGTAFGLVDRVASELGVPGSFPLGRLGQLAKAIPGRPVDQLLREVEPPPKPIGRQDPSVHPARLLLEVDESLVLQAGGMALEVHPSRRAVKVEWCPTGNALAFFHGAQALLRSRQFRSVKACVKRSTKNCSPWRSQTRGSYFFLLGWSAPSGLPIWLWR